MQACPEGRGAGAVMTYLFLGYTAIWTLLFVYFLYVSGRQRALERDLRWIREHLEAREQPVASAQQQEAR